MPKIDPRENRHLYVEERVQSFLVSASFTTLRQAGLAMAGRKELLTADEYARYIMRVRFDSEPYNTWHLTCIETGKRFGLDFGPVQMACLIKGYDPWTYRLPVEASALSVRVVTEIEDPLFQHTLNWLSGQNGLRVAARRGRVEEQLPVGVFNQMPEEPLPKSRLPSVDLAFTIVVEYPPLYPPGARQHFDEELNRTARRILRGLGYQIPRAFQPTARLFNGEAPCPMVCLLTEIEDPVFQAKLSEQAKESGLTVMARHGQLERMLRAGNADRVAQRVLDESELPRIDLAFKTRIEYPSLYPLKAVQPLVRELRRIEREVLKGLGYHAPERIRSSALVDLAGKLRMSQRNLHSGEVYEISDQIYKQDGDQNDPDLSQDQAQRRLIISKRSHLYERLIRPYQEDHP